MKIESLGRIRYNRGKRGQQGFLLSMNSELKDLHKKKIVILGCGEEGYVISNLLRDLGIEIYRYADNSELLQGTTFNGKKIYSPYELFGEDVYFIAAVQMKSIACVRWQFRVHNVTDYSLFFIMDYHDLSDEDPELNQIIFEAINEIGLKDRPAEKALPYMGVNVGEDQSRLGRLNYLIKSEEKIWTSFLWAKEFLTENKNANVLEIGPGFGLMSLVLLKSHPDINIDWIIFGDEPTKENRAVEGFECGALEVAERYSDRISYRYGYIETNDFKIDKKYDLIIFTEVFEHFALNPINTMKKIKNALKEGGRIVFSTPNSSHVHIWKDWKDMPSADDVSLEEYKKLSRCGHVYQYKKEELLDVFSRVEIKAEKYYSAETGHHNMLLY